MLQMNAAVKQAIGALQRSDVASARRIVRDDDEIDERRAGIEEAVLRLANAQQPVATDLRFLLGALRIADDLERICDYAEGIAALVIHDADLPPLDLPPALLELTPHVLDMRRTSVAGFVARDPHTVLAGT